MSNEYKEWLEDLEEEHKDLYERLVCMLMHSQPPCDTCKKCGKDSAEARMNLIRELAEYMDMELPWKEKDQ